jgi:hypothetical protein
MRHPIVPLALAACLASAPAVAGVVSVSSVDASSTEPDADGVSYAAKNLTDGKQSTAWFEGDDGSGLGSFVTLDLGGEKTITGLQVWNGFWYTSDFWQRHNRAKEIEVFFSDDSQQSFTLDDDMKPSVLTFDKPVKTSSVKVKIKAIHRGNTFNDTGISEIQVLEAASGEVVAAKGYSASSSYAADADGDYEPDNLADGILDSMWCEGVKDGDGTGEWVEFDFGGPQQVSRLRLNNGNAFSFGMFMKANHARSATLKFSDNTTETVALKGSFMEQTVSFAPRTTSKVRVTFDEVKQGKEFNDLCVSEAVFLK